MNRTREEKRQALLDWDAKGWRKGRGHRHMLELDDLYPEVDIFGPQCISAEVGAGWRDLLVPCLEVLKQHGCKAGQIKQKFGGLRFYWDFPDHIEAAIAEWRAGEPKFFFEDGVGRHEPPMPFAEERQAIGQAVKPVMDEAERLSFRTCDECGADLGREGGPSHQTRCEACKSV